MIRKQQNPLAGSFMFLCFLTAALLIAVQSRDLFSRSNANPPVAVASLPTSSPDYSLPQAGQPVLTEQAGSIAVSAGSATQTSSAEVALGLSEITATLHPVALMLRPELVVDLSDRQVILYQNGQPQVSYPIAIGKAGWETPSGEFKVLSMQENPTWQNPLTGETITNPAESPLGSRWIAFWTDGRHLIGFHGTNQTELIGQAVSHGCIRMRDPDIQAMFSQVAIGTPVRVQE